MTEPRTAAGPTTDQGLWLIEHQGLVNISKPAQHSMRGDEIDLRQSVMTIEAEARAAALDEARAAVDGIGNGERCFCDADRRPDSDQLYIHESAVRAAIDALREDADKPST